MKHRFSIFVSVVLSVFGVQAQDHKEQITTQAEQPVEVAVEARYEVKSSHTSLLGDGSGRKVIMQRVKPLVLPPPPEPAPVVEVDSSVRAARRAIWAKEAKKERRWLQLTGIYYPNGQTFLQWSNPGPDGVWQTYEAWTMTDFRSVGLVGEFEVDNTIYELLACVTAAPKGHAGRNLPESLVFPKGSPGFRIIKGNPKHIKSIEPIAALHEIYRQEGDELASKWLAQTVAAEAEAAHLKANPPPVEDIVVQVFPYKSNLFPDAEDEFEAAKAAGVAEAAAAKNR